MNFLLSYLDFFLKSFTLVIALLVTILGITLISKSKGKLSEKIKIKHINKRYQDLTDRMQNEVQSKEQLKLTKKLQKKLSNQFKKKTRKRVFYLTFNGDISATESEALREKITAILSVATDQDEVLISIESSGGMVHAYGLCASQLTRIRNKNIRLTATIDKIAASGGYLMASVAEHIIAAPFAIVGSIGVVAQLPNFHRLLKEHRIDYELITAGEYKRTLTMFGENTPKARQKLQEEIDQTHQLFKQFVVQHRPKLNIDKVATGEFWWGTDALQLNLIDQITTSDDYLWQISQNADVYEVNFQHQRSLLQKLTQSMSKVKAQLFAPNNYYQ